MHCERRERLLLVQIGIFMRADKRHKKIILHDKDNNNDDDDDNHLKNKKFMS